jgi:xylulose-5-phosphate/fructose-6-phosphate phosphoketolase
VRGFKEQGTITTPFQMVIMNEMSRFHLAAEAIRRVPRLADRAPALLADCEAWIVEATAYAREHFEDEPLVRDWVWTSVSTTDATIEKAS